MIGIYKIVNKKNGKLYIGSSKTIERRLKDHRRLLSKGTHHSSKLQNAWNKYGEESFLFLVIVECSVDALRGIEKTYIDRYNTFRSGYNCSDNTECPSNVNTPESIAKGIETRRKNGSYRITDETRRRLSLSNRTSEIRRINHAKAQAKRKKPTHQYDLDGNYIATYDSYVDAAIALNLSASTIRKNLCGKTYRYKEFIFSRTKQDKIESYYARKSKHKS